MDSIVSCTDSAKQIQLQLSRWSRRLGVMVPPKRGPFNVGHIQIEHTYQPLPDQPERTIPIEVWYPTNDTMGVPQLFMGIDESVFSSATPPPYMKMAIQYTFPVTAIRVGATLLF